MTSPRGNIDPCPEYDCGFTIFGLFDFSDDDDDLLAREELEFESGFGNVVVVDNLPVVPPEKFEKLENVVRKIYSQIGVIKEDGFWMPINPDTKKTLGYCFIEYNTPQVRLHLRREWSRIFAVCRLPLFCVDDEFDAPVGGRACEGEDERVQVGQVAYFCCQPAR